MITPRAARLHARECDPAIDFVDFDAIPIDPDWIYNPRAVMLAKPILHPATGEEVYSAGEVLYAPDLAMAAAEVGIDYVVVYR